MDNQRLVGIVFLIITLTILIMYTIVVTDCRKALIGVWSATSDFCTRSGVSAIMFNVDSGMSGTMIVVGADGKSVIVNDKFALKWCKRRKVLTPYFDNERANMRWQKSSVAIEKTIPDMITFSYKNNNVLVMSNDDGSEIYGEFQKVL